MKGKKGSLFVVIIIFIGVFYNETYGLSKPEIGNEAFEVKLIRLEKAETEFGDEYVFDVYKKATRETSAVRMKNMTTAIERLDISEKQLIVFGYVGNNIASGVTLIDLEGKKETDFIICYRPQLSDTKRYLIYEKFYPRFAPAEAKSSLILVYDLEKDPRDNRIEKKYKNIIGKSRRICDPEYLSASTNAGFPVFPKRNAKEQTYFVWEPSLKRRNHVLTYLKHLWLEYDNKIMFVNQIREEYQLISADISDGLSKVRIGENVIDVSKLLKYDVKDPNYETLLKRARQSLRIIGFQKIGDDRIKIILNQDGSKKELDIEIP